MATLAQRPTVPATGDERFFLRGAIIMAVLVVTGFSFQLAMGRSTFASPPRVHVHAVLFMGWVAIYLLQNILVSSGRIGLHRRLGWIAAVWMVAMVVSGFVVTVAMVRNGLVPFFFHPLQFLIFDPVTVLAFGGLTIAAIRLRRSTDWHRRLHFCGMSLLLAPAFGRLLPLPLLQPWAWEAAFAAAMLFPLVGAWLDARRRGSVHPAWLWGIGVIVGVFVTTQLVTNSSVGLSIYQAVTDGYPGANVPPREFAPPPDVQLRTGRG